MRSAKIKSNLEKGSKYFNTITKTMKEAAAIAPKKEESDTSKKTSKIAVKASKIKVKSKTTKKKTKTARKSSSKCVSDQTASSKVNMSVFCLKLENDTSFRKSNSYKNCAP